jgi:large repetitive protein
MTVADHSTHNQYDIGVGSLTTYDKNGKIVTRRMGSTQQDFVYSYNRLENIDGDATEMLRYDFNGNLTRNHYRQMDLSYDPFTMMNQRITTQSAEVDFQYDGRKERILKTTDINGVKTSTLYLRGLSDFPLAEKVGTSSTETDRFYVYGPIGLVAVRENNDTYFIVKDHLGSTRVVLNSNSQPVTWYDYTPYGAIWPSIVSPDVEYRFTGHEYDTEIGIHNFRARMYDDVLSIFYALDPAGQTHSPFGYAGNNPVVYVDKDGRWFVIPLFIGAVAGEFKAAAKGQQGWDRYGTIFTSAAISVGTAYTGTLGTCLGTNIGYSVLTHTGSYTARTALSGQKFTTAGWLGAVSGGVAAGFVPGFSGVEGGSFANVFTE